jgi:hypothetical protein
MYNFFQKIGNGILWLFEVNAYRKTERELSRLTNRELADIGINRSMIRSVSREAHYDNR